MASDSGIVEAWEEDYCGDHWGAAHSADRVRYESELARRSQRRAAHFIVVRHGETEVNLRPGVIGGRSNFTPLSRKGEEQAGRLGVRLAADLAGGRYGSCRVAHVHCSTALRAIHTAEIMAAAMRKEAPGILVTEPQAVDDILEMSQGAWEGRERAEVYTKEVLDTINANNWLFRAPGVSPADHGGAPGESPRTVEARVLGFLESLLDAGDAAREGLAPGSPAKDTKPIHVVVAHGVAIKAMLRSILGWNPSLTHMVHIDNTGVTDLSYSPAAGWGVRCMNDTGHLRG